MHVYLNTRVVPSAEATVSVFDHGFLYGDGVYETLRAYGGVVFMFDQHLARLFRSASLIGLDLPKDIDGIKTAVYETMEANSIADAYIRMTFSRGHGPIGLDPDLCAAPTFVIIANAFKPYPKAYYEGGITISIPTVRRNLKEALDPRIKSLNFLNNILAKIEAKRAGTDEAVMLNADGFLTEGTLSNIFFVRDEVLCTPSVDCGILDGITRSIVLDLAVRSGITVREGRFTPADLALASEVFITNTTMEVMPVSRVSGQAYAVGGMAGALLKEYAKEVRAYVADKKGEGPSLW